ncbi:MAG TPA: DUF2059 domain-containing protein [Longimicrobiaceae bacterium]|nr:DUF2059 domain-containing protein [Longimicrobiaceae bacterium]
MRRTLLALALALVLSVPAAAQNTTPSPARMKAAAELLEAMNVEAILRETADATLQTQIQQQPVLAAYEDIMRDFMARAMKWEDLRADYTRLYADVYTEDELRQLRTFYQTPLGRRLLATQPRVAALSMEITNRRLEKFLPEMQKQIMERMMAESDTPKPER